MDERGRLLSNNDAWHEFLGVSDEAWLRERWMSYLHPEDRRDLEHELKEPSRSGSLHAHVRLRRAEGQYCPMHLRAFGQETQDGHLYAGLLTDASDADIEAPRGAYVERRQELAEAAVRAFSARSRRLADDGPATDGRRSVDALLAASPDAMALVDREGRYVHVNDELARITGLGRQNLIGRRVEEFYPTIWEAIARYYLSALAGDLVGDDPESDELEVTVPRADGDDSQMLVRVYPVTGQQGLLLGLGVSLTDITNRKRMEDALREANALKDEFLSIASHELRNPVAAVRGSAQLLMRSLRRGSLDQERLQTHLASILRASEHLAGLTGDLLDVSRLQRGQFPVRPRRASLRALTERLVARHAAGRRCRVRTPEGACVAYVDPSRFEQILENLLDNAHKYAPGDSPIEVSIRDEADGLLLEVRDDGMGLPSGAAEEIFKPFGRAPNAIVNNVPGLGLGLYICRRIAEQTGGRLWAESDGEGAGTAMFAWFPYDGPSEAGSEQ